MILLITPSNARKYKSILERVFKFRHEFFVSHLGWEALRKPDSREIDEFDRFDNVHLVGMDGERVISYTRLLPTTQPHLLSHVYPELLDGAEEPTGPDIWEWTRCAVAPELREGRKAVDRASAEIVLGVVEACVLLGIRALHVQTHPMLLTRMIETGWLARPLSLPRDFDGQPVVPIFGELQPNTLATSRSVYGLSDPVLLTETSIPEIGPQPFQTLDADRPSRRMNR